MAHTGMLCSLSAPCQSRSCLHFIGVTFLAKHCRAGCWKVCRWLLWSESPLSNTNLVFVALRRKWTLPFSVITLSFCALRIASYLSEITRVQCRSFCQVYKETWHGSSWQCYTQLPTAIQLLVRQRSSLSWIYLPCGCLWKVQKMYTIGAFP